MTGREAASPWRPTEAARALRWWSESGMQRLSDDLRVLLQAWSVAWDIPCNAAGLRCGPPQPQGWHEGDWIAFEAGGHAQAWLRLPDDGGAALLTACFGVSTRVGLLARAVIDGCQDDLVARIAGFAGLVCRAGSSAPDPGLARFASGTLDVDFPAPLNARLRIGPGIAARWNVMQRTVAGRRLEPLATVLAALGNHPLTLDLELEGCELEVGALQGLQIGDVVRLGHGLHRPAAFRHAGAPVCNAYLGRRGIRKAVELATGEAQR